MTLTILGKKLDTSLEHEVFDHSDFGFNAKIKFIQDCPYEGETHIYHNLHEVHHLCDMFQGRSSWIAFESDIHGTGCVREIRDIESVIVTKAYKLYKTY